MTGNQPNGAGDRPFFGRGGVILTVVCGIVLFGLAIWRWAPNSESLKSWGEYLTGAGTVGLVAGALYAAAAALREYQRERNADQQRVQLEKAKWLSDLYQSFYETGSYKKIRRKIDFGDVEDILKLIGKDAEPHVQFSEADRELFDEFTDYLNLFEFVSYLSTLNQLDAEDIKALFAYYLQRLVEVDTDGRIRRYLADNGYGNLSRLLKGYEK